MFTAALSDTNQNQPCKSSTNADPNAPDAEQDIAVPDDYDWRKEYADCLQPVLSIGTDTNCSASYAMAVMSTVEDHICMKNGNTSVRLSSQEIIDCDSNSYGCSGGYVNKVLQFGRNKGFILDECMEYNAK